MANVGGYGTVDAEREQETVRRQTEHEGRPTGVHIQQDQQPMNRPKTTVCAARAAGACGTGIQIQKR